MLNFILKFKLRKIIIIHNETEMKMSAITVDILYNKIICGTVGNMDLPYRSAYV